MMVKDETLKRNGSFNNNHENVHAGIFNTTSFFDKRDIVQVKYEMIRAASKKEGSISEIADLFGFSRKSYYQISKAFETDGLCALLPKKTGPKGASKLNPDVLEFIDSFIDGHKTAKSKEISAALEAEMGIKVHPRTIYRHLKKN
jgi:transposase